MEADAARLLRARRRLARASERPHLRPLGVADLGPRDRPLRPRDHDRPLVEAAAGAVHDPVQLRRRRRRAAAVDRGRPRRRHPRLRDGVPARRSPGRADRRRDRGVLAVPRRRVHPQLRARQLRGDPGRAVPVGDRAPPRRPPPRRVPARRRRRPAAPRGVAVHRALRALSDPDRPAREDGRARARERARRW